MAKHLISRHESDIVRGLYGAGYGAHRIARWLYGRLVEEICTVDYARTYSEVRRVLRGPAYYAPVESSYSVQCPSDIRPT